MELYKSKNILFKKKNITLGDREMTELKGEMEIRNQQLSGEGSVVIHN